MKLNLQKCFPPFDRWPGRGDWILALAIMAVVAFSAWKGTSGKSNTVDELVHMLAGHAAWQLNDYRLNPENGTLSCRIAALPLQFMDEVPPIDITRPDWEYSRQWSIGNHWLFDPGVDHYKILQRSRLAMLLFNMSGIALVFLASARIWGRGGGFLSLILVGFSPSFLGHLPLAVSDLAGTWTLFLSILAFARLVEEVTISRILFSGVTAALAVLTKHSGVMLLPIASLLLLWRIFDGRSLRVRLPRLPVVLEKAMGKFNWLLSVSIIAACLCISLIWLAYGFRYSAANPAHGAFVQFQIPWENLNETLATPVIGLFRQWKLLPEAFLYGIQFISAHDTRGGFLNGAFSPNGFPLYHVWTFLYKTPLPSMALILFGLGCFINIVRLERSIIDHIIVRSALMLILVYSLMLAFSNISIGHRHAFPVLFTTMILAGAVFPCSRRYHVGYTAVTVMLALSLPFMAWSHIDRTIAYINILGGGKEKGYQRLADSSLDWGQDLPSAIAAIQVYQSNNPRKPVYLSYFGSASPTAFGLKNAEYLESYGSWKRRKFLPEIEPGLYVFSSSALVTTQSTWTIEHEAGYRLSRKKAIPIYANLIAHSGLGLEEASGILSKEELKSLREFEYVRAQRLKSYLRNRIPDEIIHGTILLFELNQEELIPFKLDYMPDKP